MTIFTTPVLRPILKFISWIVLLFWGWRPTMSAPPGIKKAVLIVAPHTSYWDFALFLPMVFTLNLRLRVLIKHTLFWPPLGWFLRYCGGIPVDRRAARNYVKELAGEFEKRDFFHLLITPEGTRSPPLYVELDESSVGEIDWHSPFRDGTAMWRVTIGDWCAMPLPLVSFANVEDDQ